MIAGIEVYLRSMFGRCASLCNSDAFRNFLACGSEVLFIAFISCLPIFVNAFVVIYSSESLSDWSDLLARTVGKGQLWIYSISTAATVLWLSIHVGRIVVKTIFVIFCISIVTIVCIITVIDSDLNKVKNLSLVNMSMFIFFIINVLYVILLIISRKAPPSVSESIGSGVNALRRRVKSRANQDA